MNISVVIPLYNEEESIPELHSWIERVMRENGFSYEIIYVDDGSTDNSWEIMNLLERINLQGTTILMATHNSQIVNTLRHRVIAIEDGHVVRDEVEGAYGYDE